VRYDIIRSVTINNTVFWDVTPRSLLGTPAEVSTRLLGVMSQNIIFFSIENNYVYMRQHNFLFSKLNKTHCMNQNIFICFL
jgi:hypothetical protein